jgi:hypothetical protein
MRRALFHPLLFYPTLAALALMAVLFSLRPAWPDPHETVMGAQRAARAFDYGANNLAATATGPAHVSYIVRDTFGLPQSLRLARTMASVGQDLPGAVMPLTPEDAAAFAQGPVVADVVYRPIPINTAEGFSLRWAGTQAWISTAIEPREGQVSLVLPETDTPPTGLEIRIDSTRADYAYGLEILAIRLTPAAGEP